MWIRLTTRNEKTIKLIYERWRFHRKSRHGQWTEQRSHVQISEMVERKFNPNSNSAMHILNTIKCTSHFIIVNSYLHIRTCSSHTQNRYTIHLQVFSKQTKPRAPLVSRFAEHWNRLNLLRCTIALTNHIEGPKCKGVLLRWSINLSAFKNLHAAERPRGMFRNSHLVFSLPCTFHFTTPTDITAHTDCNTFAAACCLYSILSKMVARKLRGPSITTCKLAYFDHTH